MPPNQLQHWFASVQVYLEGFPFSSSSSSSLLSLLEFFYAASGNLIDPALVPSVAASSSGNIDVLKFALAKNPKLPLVNTLTEAIANGHLEFVEYYLKHAENLQNVNYGKLLLSSLGSMSERMVEFMMDKAKVKDLKEAKWWTSPEFFKRYRGKIAHHRFWRFLIAKGLKYTPELFQDAVGGAGVGNNMNNNVNNSEVLAKNPKVFCPSSVEFNISSEVFSFYANDLKISPTVAQLTRVVRVIDLSGVRFLKESTALYPTLFRFLLRAAVENGELRMVKYLLLYPPPPTTADLLIGEKEILTALSSGHLYLLDYFFLSFPSLFAAIDKLFDKLLRGSSSSSLHISLFHLANSILWLKGKGLSPSKEIFSIGLKKGFNVWSFRFFFEEMKVPLPDSFLSEIEAAKELNSDKKQKLRALLGLSQV